MFDGIAEYWYEPLSGTSPHSPLHPPFSDAHGYILGNCEDSESPQFIALRASKKGADQGVVYIYEQLLTAKVDDHARRLNR